MKLSPLAAEFYPASYQSAQAVEEELMVRRRERPRGVRRKREKRFFLSYRRYPPFPRRLSSSIARQLDT